VIDAMLRDAATFRGASARQTAAAGKLTRDLSSPRVGANLALANAAGRPGTRTCH
jgi:hypothetical protein